MALNYKFFILYATTNGVAKHEEHLYKAVKSMMYAMVATRPDFAFW